MTNWFVLHIRSGQEKKVKRYLENLQAKLPDQVKRVLQPTEQVTEMSEGEKKIKSQYFMPGYMILELEDNEEILHEIQTIPGILGFLGDGKNPAPLSEEEVKNILSLVEERKEKPLLQYEFARGDQVEIRDGPFANFSGLVEEVNSEKEKIKVSVSIFGRSTLVELDVWQVEKV